MPPVVIKGFKGLETVSDPAMLRDGELSECKNFDLGLNGELVKRTGMDSLHSGATLGNNRVRIIGHFLTATHSQILAVAGGNLYRSDDGATWTLIGAYDVEFGVQYAGEFYMVRKTSIIVKWDGTTATTIAGSPSGTFCLIYKDRLFVLNSEGIGNLNSRLYFSKAGDLSATGWPSTNFIDIRPGDGDFLTCLAVLYDTLFVFKGKSTWGLYTAGELINWSVRNINPEIGCISKYTPREIEGVLYFSGARGVYKTDGTSFMEISQQIANVLRDRVVNLTTINNDSFAWWQDKLICLLSPISSSQQYYVYHIRPEGWTKWEFVGGILPSTFLEIRTTTPQAGVYAGDISATGKIFRYGASVYADVGIAFESKFSTKDLDLETPLNMKRGKWAIIDVRGAGSLTWFHTVDGAARNAVMKSSISTRSGVKIAGPGYFRTWKFTAATTTTVLITVFSIVLEVTQKRTLIKANT